MFTRPETSYNKSKKYIEKWKTYNGYKRDEYYFKGFILSKKVKKYLEFYDNKSYPQYDNECFDEWQRKLSKYIHEGYNTIVDVKTSCGKTWAVNQIIAYETLSTTDKNALIVIPNQSILLDTVQDISENHTKRYKHGKKMINFSTSKWSSLDDDSLNCQILCLTADTVIYYLDKKYDHFFKNIKYIVFDEVHLPEISRILWKLSFLPFKCQYILLSATLGDTTLICDELRKYRQERSIRKIKYDIRPIPLQRVLFKKGIELSKAGLLIERDQLDNKTAFTLQLNLNDPTPRDIKKMMIMTGEHARIPKSREEQYLLGTEVVDKFINSDSLTTYMKEEYSLIRNSVQTCEPMELLTLLQNLFARGMGPVLIFNPNPMECVRIVKQMTAILNNIEDKDEEVRENIKMIKRMEKKAKRKRDKVKWKQEAKNFQEAKERDGEIVRIPELSNKWRFPYNDEYKLKGKHIEEYVHSALDYGIGIHIESMKHSLRRQIFNMFRKKAIQVLVADIGLSVGVNLPARSVVLTGNITPTLYKQMGGRAGRRGLDNQGYIIPLVDNISELLHSKQESFNINTLKPFSFIDTIQFNNNGYDSLKYDMLSKYVSSLDERGEQLYLEKYKWLKRTGLIDCKWTKILTEMDIDRVIYLVYLINQGLAHYYCSTEIDEDKRLFNLLVLLCYFIDPGLEECTDDNILPALPNNIISALKPLETILSEDNYILNLRKTYSNYIIQFYNDGTITDIKKIAAFQLKLFQFVKIIRKIVINKYYRLEKPDVFYETLNKLDTVLWSKCYKMKGATSGLY